ncbi:MAG: AAA family ATPase [Tannerellaceae bacterium]|jgi:predicted ATPase|nr:AAA family ATPase [Tannerellaceae bacterium]
MITRIEIDGFKSFKDFAMDFTPFTVLAGANGSGKSNLFDALQLLSRLADMELRTAFGGLRGEGYELFTKYDDETSAKEMSFAVEMLVDGTVRDNWGGEAMLENTRMRYEIKLAMRTNKMGMEEIFITHESLIPLNPDNLKPEGNSESHVAYIRTTDKGGLHILEPNEYEKPKERLILIALRQSALSNINNVGFPQIFAAREEMRAWKFLQFNPEDLREPTRQGSGSGDVISRTGKNLGAALFILKHEDPYNLVAISRKINEFLPEFIDIDVIDDRANRQFIITLKNADGKVFTSRVLSEGTLRLIALAVLLYDDRHTSLLCFEEPENGIHPQRIKSMVRLLKELSSDFDPDYPDIRQVIVNTHSPRLVEECMKLGDQYTSIRLIEMISCFCNIDGHRYSFPISKALPVSVNGESESGDAFSERDRKLGLYEINKYLSEQE